MHHDDYDSLMISLKNEINKLCKKIFRKNKFYKIYSVKNRKRFQKRTGNTPRENFFDRQFFHNHFNPKYCKRNANSIAKLICNKLCDGTYKPIPAISRMIPKPGGGHREVMIFAIPDAALSNIVFRNARARNLVRFSPASFAYHPHRGVPDAVRQLRDITLTSGYYSVQIDFEKFFDSLPHRYLIEALGPGSAFDITPVELLVIERFLNHDYATLHDYRGGQFKQRCVGTPQGASISMLVANMALDRLDHLVSLKAKRYLRYADDTIAVCKTFEEASLIANEIKTFCNATGIKINLQKSPGIVYINNNCNDKEGMSHIDYLGFQIKNHALSLPQKKISVWKTRVTRIINLHLIHYLKIDFNIDRCGFAPRHDWDLLALIHELRSLIYGNVGEHDIAAALRSGSGIKELGGMLRNCYMLEDIEQLKRLDGFMLNAVRLAMQKRNKILQAKYGHGCPTPTNEQLLTGEWLDAEAWHGADLPDARMPSFVRAWRVLRKFYLRNHSSNYRSDNDHAYSP
jgi:RNA-directed DNA polymerase